MKKNVIFLICMFLIVTVFGQNQSTSVKVENDVTPPRFIGSENVVSSFETDNSVLIDKYIRGNIICPEKTSKCLAEGTEIVQFTVTPSGDVTNFNIVNSVCPELDKEVIKVLRNTNGLWKPGLKNGIPVAMDKEIEFMLGIYSNRNAMIKHFTKNATNYFKKGSKQLLENNNPRKALDCFNKGIIYTPNDKAMLMLRGLCLYKMGDKESAQRDWNRIVELGCIDPIVIDKKITEMKGYQVMTEILSQN